MFYGDEEDQENFHEIQRLKSDLDTIKRKLKQYLAYGSIDGRTERQALRAELLALAKE